MTGKMDNRVEICVANFVSLNNIEVTTHFHDFR